MKFQFFVNLTEQDYVDYNFFVSMKSPYGKSQRQNLRISIATVFLALISLLFLIFDISIFTVLFSVLLIIGLILFQIFFHRYILYCVKVQIETIKKTGKISYSPFSTLEFYDDYFIENTSENITQQKYSSIERVSIVENKIIYIHINSVMSFIIPISCFVSNEQLNSFIDFLKTKCLNVDVY